MSARLTFAESARRYAELLARISYLTSQMERCEEQYTGDESDGFYHVPPCWEPVGQDGRTGKTEYLPIEDRCGACRRREPLFQERRRLRKKKAALQRSFTVAWCRESEVKP